ncbi:MAG TPA: hypothetical protein VGQ75_10465 [Thermoanaerobaculia bacterium]|jgi:hypothetical protein|nr:hypothetical protein [Thermoanaerobaculia bacterium]HEV8608878.1 hypothetical protein [Thermoanaerobaculia bacterium]
MKGSKEKVADDSPPEGPYLIRTGFYFDDERTGRRFEVLVCSDDQTGPSWLEEERVVKGKGRLRCRWEHRTHGKTHAVISLGEAVQWGVLDVAEGCVLIENLDLLRTLARRIA